MSDTKDIFEKEILPLSKNGKDYAKMELDANADSYYESPKYPDYLYYNTMDLSNEASFKEELTKVWKNDPELHDLAGSVADVAFKLKAKKQEQSEELSEFVYVMF